MADIPRVNISTDAEITWIRLQQLSGDPDNANAADHFNFGINGTTLTWVDELGNVYTAASGSNPDFSDADFTIYNDADPTKTFQFSAASITAGQNRIYTMPNATTTIVGIDVAQVLTNKTISGASNTLSNISAASVIAGTFGAGAYIFTHATATGVPVTIDSSDNSTTNPLIRGRDSSAVVRWQIDYEGTARLGRTSGGTYNGNILLAMHDQFPSFGFRSGTTERGKLIADVNANSFILETGQLDVRATGGNPIARFGTTSAALSVGTNATSGDTTLWANLENATTNATDNVLTVSHNSSGTPAASFGGAVVFKLESSTTTFQLAARLRWQWTTATHASRTARGILSAYDTAERDCFMWEASGAAPMLGFFGTNPVVKPTVTGSRGGNAALASLLTALAGEGLLTDSTTA